MGVKKDSSGFVTIAASLDKPAYNVSDVLGTRLLSRTQLYLEHRQGRLPFRKMGKRTLILREDFEKWLKALPAE